MSECDCSEIGEKSQNQELFFPAGLPHNNNDLPCLSNSDSRPFHNSERVSVTHFRRGAAYTISRSSETLFFSPDFQKVRFQQMDRWWHL